MRLDRIIAVRNTKTVYRDGNRCVKVFGASHRKADILNEALNNVKIEETGIRIPKLLEVTSIDGKWALIYEFIPGKTLAELMEKHPERKAEYLDRFVDVQLSVLAHSCPTLMQLKDEMRRKLDQAALDAATRNELHTRLEGMQTHNHVCHGDFNPSNIIITQADEAYIIDWSHAAQGSASADAAHTYLLFRLDGEEETAQKYLDLFCKKSGTAKQYVKKWLPIVAASRSAKGNENERVFPLQSAGVID